MNWTIAPIGENAFSFEIDGPIESGILLVLEWVCGSWTERRKFRVTHVLPHYEFGPRIICEAADKEL